MELKVGIQLYSVRELMKEDPIRTIEQVAEAGYKYIEVANHNAMDDDGVGFGVTAEKLKELMKKSGCKVISAHIFPFNDENYKRVIEYNQKIGNHVLVYPMEVFKDRDDVLKKAEYYEKMGYMAAQEGMTFLYHNHYQEFQEFKGERVLDTILKNTDPGHVNLELDTFWTLRGGLDPIDMMKQYGTRIKMLHQKDFSRDTTTPVNMFDVVGKDSYIDRETFVKYKCNDDFIEIGYGRMDIQGIIDTAIGLGSIEYILLEQDATKLNQLDSIKRSMEGFRKFKGIIWE
ncbi:sugar phosphate isomerase/epimerase family protein [Anaerocolumna jejuensis]|uniref:sugar phosphate isomerase/epimerase family protein n=1 Tax=Anaerocolumna jejuensis TaxID=259063 RepID=UPI003F7C2161